MSSGFPFGQKPNETPQFRQSSFGQFPVGGAPASTATTTQFSTTFGATPGGSFQFSTPTSPLNFGTSFNLNSPPTQTSTAATPSFGFGTSTPAYSMGGTTPGLFSKPTTTASSFFQSPTSVANTTVSGFSMMGAKSPFTSAPTTGMFANPANTSTGALPSSLNFGASPPTQTMSRTTFGTPLSSMPKMTFSTSTGMPFTTTPTMTTAGLSYGLTSTTPKLPFGPSVASTPLTFSSSQIPATSTALNFSIPKSTQQTVPSYAPTTSAGLTFGKPVSQSFGLNFSSAPAPSLSFATPATTTQTGLNLGTLTPTSLGFSLQPTSSAAPPLAATFATSAVSASLPSSTTTAALTFGTASQTSVTSAAPPTLSFSAVAPLTGATITTTTTTSSLSFGTPLVTSAATAASTGLSFGLGAVSTTATPTSTFGLGGQPPSTSAPTVGLGGISSTPPKQTTPATTAQAQIAPKDQPLPNELLQTVEQFKKFVQEQKNFSSEIARCSIKELRRVETDVDLVNNCINELENEMRKNKAMAEKIKYDTAKGLQNAEMAQRTFETPAGLQYENTAPFEYFIELSDNFEKEMTELKLRIESVNKHVKNSMNPTKLNSQDLALGMRRLHDTFVALAGQLQSVHNQVEMQKEQYLNLRKVMLNDYTNVFETQSKESKGLETILSNLAKQQPHTNSSPTPFNLLRSSQVQTVAQNSSTTLPAITTIGAPGLYMQTTTTMPLFGSTLSTTPSFFNMTASNNAFQLQKPPVGNKRGKP